MGACMYRLAACVVLSFASVTSHAQLQPMQRVIRNVADPSMVIDDRGAKLEVLAARRATQQPTGPGRQVIHSVFAADEAAAISPQQLGVVFNHAMQAQGYITGEIAFKMKDGVQATDKLDPVAYPGLAKLTEPNIYIVVARTPPEFVQLVNRLQNRNDMEWVEPIVTYGATEATPATR